MREKKLPTSIDRKTKKKRTHAKHIRRFIMGIPKLTKHLLPYAENVYLDSDMEVVIDGPSLVYHVHRRLQGWMDPDSDILDYQPSCDEISRAVGSFLLQLTKVGVKMQVHICPVLGIH